MHLFHMIRAWIVLTWSSWSPWPKPAASAVQPPRSTPPSRRSPGAWPASSASSGAGCSTGAGTAPWPPRQGASSSTGPVRRWRRSAPPRRPGPPRCPAGPAGLSSARHPRSGPSSCPRRSPGTAATTPRSVSSWWSAATTRACGAACSTARSTSRSPSSPTGSRRGSESPPPRRSPWWRRCRPITRWPRARRIPRAALADLGIITLVRGEGMRTMLDELFAELDVAPDIRFELSDRELLVPFVAAGLGATVLPERFAARPCRVRGRPASALPAARPEGGRGGAGGPPLAPGHRLRADPRPVVAVDQLTGGRGAGQPRPRRRRRALIGGSSFRRSSAVVDSGSRCWPKRYSR